jgi:hypothetical protein
VSVRPLPPRAHRLVPHGGSEADAPAPTQLHPRAALPTPPCSRPAAAGRRLRRRRQPRGPGGRRGAPRGGGAPAAGGSSNALRGVRGARAAAGGLGRRAGPCARGGVSSFAPPAYRPGRPSRLPPRVRVPLRPPVCRHRAGARARADACAAAAPPCWCVRAPWARAPNITHAAIARAAAALARSVGAPAVPYVARKGRAGAWSGAGARRVRAPDTRLPSEGGLSRPARPPADLLPRPVASTTRVTRPPPLPSSEERPSPPAGDPPPRPAHWPGRTVEKTQR